MGVVVEYVCVQCITVWMEGRARCLCVCVCACVCVCVCVYASHAVCRVCVSVWGVTMYRCMHELRRGVCVC